MHALRSLRSSVVRTGLVSSRAFTTNALFRSTTVTPRLFNATKTVLIASRNAHYRSYSVLTESPEAKLYTYEDVKKLATNSESHPETVLVDVREPIEFSEGHIPGAINLPFKTSPGALELNEDDFLESFGFEKPSRDKELVFYCLGGVRSTAAEELARTFGYNKRGNYVGSYEDWVANENKK